jgi:hypothetical protein
MATTEVACPHCGQKTWATIPDDDYSVTAVRTNPVYQDNDSQAGCGECEENFGIEYN